MHGEASQERVECAAPHICCYVDHTGDMLGWENSKLPPRALVMCLGQKGKVTKNIDVGFESFKCFFGLVFCLFVCFH